MKYKKYKKYIGEVILDYEISQIKKEIFELPEEKRTNLLKEYIIEKDYLGQKMILQSDDITKKIKQQNKRTIKYIIRKLDKKYKIQERKNNYNVRYFFSLFEGYTEKDVLNVVETLINEERKLLYKKYGNDLKSTEPRTITDEENRIVIFHIVRKIKNRLEKLKTGKFIIIEIKDVLPYNDKEIEKLLLNCSKKLKEKIYFNFGEDLKKKTIIEKNRKETFFLKEEKEIIEKILNNNKQRHKNFNTLISQFESVRKPNETDEELLIRIKRNLIKINNDYIELLTRKYSENLQNNELNGSYTKEENKTIIRIIIPCIKGFMTREEKNLKTKTGTLKEIKKLLNTEEYKNLVKLYGTKYATGIMIKLYVTNEFNLDGILEINEEDKILISILTKEYLQMKKELLTEEKIDIKKLIRGNI